MKSEQENKSTAVQKTDVADWTICESTAQMLKKAQNDGVDTAFDRAAAMKPCPIGADSACCKHCAMGPCCLNSKDPYSKVPFVKRVPPKTLETWRRLDKTRLS